MTPTLTLPTAGPDCRRLWTNLPPARRMVLNQRAKWLKAARPSQLPPRDDSWHTWLLLAGRGFGKTRAGAEEFAWQLLSHDNWRGAIIAPTEGDARDTCMEGESGLLGILPPACIDKWNRSLGELRLFNGSRVKLFSADVPERLRGPQHHIAWADELGAWRYSEALDQLRFGLRLGQLPRLIVTTTPRPLPMLRAMTAQQGVHVTRGNTFENAANLAPTALAELRARYEGTRLGRQELYAELVDDVPGALWSHSQLDTLRVKAAPALRRIIIAIDPAVTSGEQADATGIIAAGLGEDGKAYVLADATLQAPPHQWARRAVALYEGLEADLVIGEVNQGGDLVESVLRTIAPHLPYRAVRANRGKLLRAEPVAALYEQGKVRHAGCLNELEDEMARFAPGVIEQNSPDRVDALVWAITELMLKGSEPRLRSLS